VLWHSRAGKDRERNLEPPEPAEPQTG
jgi:hypothetical protein